MIYLKTYEDYSTNMDSKSFHSVAVGSNLAFSDDALTNTDLTGGPIIEPWKYNVATVADKRKPNKDRDRIRRNKKEIDKQTRLKAKQTAMDGPNTNDDILNFGNTPFRRPEHSVGGGGGNARQGNFSTIR